MTVKSGQSVTVLFATADATSGAAADATVGPVGTLYVDGTASAAVVTVANITTGLYKATVTLPTLTAGQIVSLRIAATVGAAGEGVVWQDGADTTLASDLAAVLPSAAAGAAGGLPVLDGTGALQVVVTPTGSSTLTYTVTNSVDGTPIADVTVEVYADVSMSTLVTTGITNASGVVTFYLDPGTYYLRRVKSGWNFVNPDTEIVT